MLGFQLCRLIHGLDKTLGPLNLFSIYARMDCGFVTGRAEAKTVKNSEEVWVNPQGLLAILSFFENQYFFQHHSDHDTSPVISFVPNYGDTPLPPMENTKPLHVYKRRRRESATAPKHPDTSTSSCT